MSTPAWQPRTRRTVAISAAAVLAFGFLGPLAPTATAEPSRPPVRTTPGPKVTTPAPGTQKAAARDAARAAAQLRKADRAVVSRAPKGMAAFVLWLESIGARKHLGPVRASRVKADVAQLDRLAPKAVRDLSKMSDAKAQRLLAAVVRSEMTPALNATHAHFVDGRGFYFYANLQRQLERMGRKAGSTGSVGFLPSPAKRRHMLTLTQHQREFSLDQDADGVSDAFDPDIDGSGGENAADRADNRWGIPEEHLLRTPFIPGPVTTDRPAPAWSSCLHARETIPRFMTITAATTFQRARGCARLGATAGVAPGNLEPPTTTGAATVGSTLTAEPGTWSGDPAPTFTFRWQYEDASGGWPNVSGANSATYVIQPGDSGRVLRVNVTATNSAGSAEQISDTVGPIDGTPSGPVNVAAPTVTGSARVGGQLVAGPGTWSGSPTSYGYQWQRNTGSWTAIGGATASAYTPEAADVGDPLRIVVTANNAGGQGTASSAATAPVTNPAQPPANTALPAISGKAAVGSVLTVSPGTWTGSPTFGYQWQRSTSSGGWSSIGGATAASYTATSADTGLSLQVVVTAQNDAGSASTTAPEIGPVTNPSGACTVTPTTDTDHDGVPDCKEIAGFTLNVATTGTGAVSQRKVTSDPNNADTDGDKIADGLEWQGFASDPSTADTDGDGLSDYDEFIVYKSLPANVDSDGDAVVPNSNPRSADPRLLDGSEVQGYGFAGATISTSPTLSDTDGDSLSDYTEINGGGFNPLVADMPKLDVGVPDNVETDIQIFTTRKDGTSSTTYKGTTTTTTDSKKTHAVDLTNVKTLNTNSTTLDVGGKGGYTKGKPYGEAHLNIKSTWQTGTVTDHQTGSTTDTVHTTQQRYQEYRQDTSTSDVETAPNGTLSTAITLHNSGTVTYTAKDLTVTAFRTDPNNPGSIQPIATLALASSVGDITLAPGDTKGPFQVSSTTVSSDLLVELLANPDGIIYSVPTPSLVNPANSQSYAVVGQNVQAQTAGVGIDDGSGEPRTYLVATNVARNPDGSAAGIQLKSVLDSILHTDYSTCNQNDGRQVLCRIGTVSSTDEDHFWSILSSTDVAEGGNFDDLHLQIGSVARLVYLVDTDADQLFDPQENLYGTDIAHADTDGDGLTDYDETQTGWRVPKIGSQAAYQVYPSPLSTDVDGDGSPDRCPGTATTCAGSSYPPESVRKTDPNLPDTNSDGLTDGSQELPDALLYCPGCYRAPDFATSLGNGQGDGDGQFGTYESFPGLDGPGAIAVNRASGDVFVADPSNHRVERFGPDGKFKLDFGSKGNGDGQFDFTIASIAVDNQGNVYVSDITLEPPAAPYRLYSGRVQKFTSSGTHLATLALDGGPFVALDVAGNVFTNTVNYDYRTAKPIPAILQRYTPTLKLVTTYTGPEAAGTGLTVGPDGRIFMTARTGSDLSSSVLQRWTPPALAPDANSGTFTGAAFISPVSDPHGLLYVADSGSSRILKLNPDNFDTYLQLGGPGSGNGQFTGLRGVAVDTACNLYASDGGNFRVQVLSYGTGCS